MPRSSQTIKKSALDKTVAELKKLPSKPKDVFTLRDAIYEIYSDIQAVIAKGYSFEEVAALLSKGGIEIKAITLKQYLADYRHKGQKTTGSKTKKSTVIDSAPTEGSTKDQPQSETIAPEVKKDKATKSGSKSSSSSDGFVDMPDDL